MNTLNIIIPNRLIGQRVDVAIATMLPDYSRSKITAWLHSNQAVANKKPLKPKTKITGGEVITLTIKNEKINTWRAENIPLNIIFADDDIIVINKPAGLVTHPGAGNSSGTLANALLYFDPNLANLDRAGIVHRLDKNTSGLLVVARSKLAQKNLSEQLQAHQISRQYCAIIYGHMISGGSIDAPIGRDPRDRTKQAVVESGKPALTHYRIIERFAHHTHIKVILKTGRTHQIRVHLSHIGYPLIADTTYGGKIRFPKGAHKNLKYTLKNFKRQALHAQKLSLSHPISDIKMSWTVPLPNDMQTLLKSCKEYDIS